MEVRRPAGESAPRRWRSGKIAPPRIFAHSLIRIVGEIENVLGEMDVPQKHAVFTKLVSTFVVLTFDGNKGLQKEYGKRVAQAFLEFNMEVACGKEGTEEWRYYTPDGEAPATGAGGEQN